MLFRRRFTTFQIFAICAGLSETRDEGWDERKVSFLRTLRTANEISLWKLFTVTTRKLQLRMWLFVHTLSSETNKQDKFLCVKMWRAYKANQQGHTSQYRPFHPSPFQAVLFNKARITAVEHTSTKISSAISGESTKWQLGLKAFCFVFVVFQTVLAFSSNVFWNHFEWWTLHHHF